MKTQFRIFPSFSTHTFLYIFYILVNPVTCLVPSIPFVQLFGEHRLKKHLFHIPLPQPVSQYNHFQKRHSESFVTRINKIEEKSA